MSKRAEQAAYNYAKKNGTLGYDYNQIYDAAKNGYEQAEKETIKRAVKWMKLHTYTFENVEEVVLYINLFRKAMEEE